MEYQKKDNRVVVDDNWRITKANSFLALDIEWEYGGETISIPFGSVVLIKTKYDRNVVGVLAGFNLATEEGRQDSLVIENNNGKIELIGIYDIIRMELP
ncbi:MAG: hypothetical protein IKN54_04725 [Lachnospiraceae bacterium]|nr:hypothetical protein [Lachnospiraceae bacterium]